MRIAITQRLDREEEEKPFEVTYYLNNYYKEIFDKLDILLIPVISENRLEEVCSLCDGLILTGSSNDVYPKYYNEEPIKERTYDTFDEFPFVKKAAETLQLLLDYGTDLDIRTNVGYGIDETGREMLKNFENDYGKVKENVPDYDDIVSIINNLEL